MKADVRFDAFVTEYIHDYFMYWRDGSQTFNITAAPAVPFWTNTGPGTLSLQAQPLSMLFVTDYSVTNTGFSIGRARVCCDSGQNNNTITMVENTRYYGMVLATNDVVYAKYYPPTNRDVTVALWGTGPDIDLYVRCGALPTPTQWDYRGFSSDAQEFVHIPANQCPGTALYIAGHAFNINGAQTFNMAVHAHDPGHHIVGMMAKTTFNATSTQIASLGVFCSLASGGSSARLKARFIWIL